MTCVLDIGEPDRGSIVARESLHYARHVGGPSQEFLRFGFRKGDFVTNENEVTGDATSVHRDRQKLDEPDFQAFLEALDWAVAGARGLLGTAERA
ncbi:hypothetical protein M446_1794 [Methylobacterium sp. 4-46]|nr:hypothetical protein M446_1794 [Methylobacterium sp. 4-46]